ncbi:hypothetical protein SAMN04488133_1996 [Halobellus limi]|uniref:Uncharacterized protein n=1 Tax=Halobellus limi TaxID=699433 RepID=A0A1H5ZGK8_9EURY|nr:hypothetical protein SAMN04488133_1996 [Halobellus limi]
MEICELSEQYCLIDELELVPYTGQYAAVSPDFCVEICEATDSLRMVAKVGSNHVDVVVDSAMPYGILAVPSAMYGESDGTETTEEPIYFARRDGLKALVVSGIVAKNGPR